MSYHSEIEMLECRSVDFVGYHRLDLGGSQLEWLVGKQYKLFWIGNEKGFEGIGIFLAKKWVEKVTDISRVTDGMINKVLVLGIIISVISVYTWQCSLDDN